ncbi:hypothetical protein M5K25_024073 [Dendrobium thyrsiflorum]|uniref:Uncharacterized protein n=1 Tax=Dendrobium thyrsiflorum TaxID=117978 RepID=A0ABD0U1C7_DENTH
MSPDQGSEALLEGSSHNSDYQTISKLDDLIVESSGSTRRIQRAQEHRIPASLSQKIIHRIVHDQEIQHRSSIRTTPHLPPIYKPCHFRKSINRALILHEKGPKFEGSRERSETALAPLLLLGHRRSSAEPPPEGSTFCRTTT